MSATEEHEAHWMQAGDAQRAFGLSRKHLRELVLAGAVRAAKLGEAKQSMRLYCVKDIDRALLDVAAGRVPGHARRTLCRKGQ